MTIREFVRSLHSHVTAKPLPGKYLILESDDWGCIRMSDLKTYSLLESKGYPVNLCSYNKFDSLESPDDLFPLYDALRSVKDSQNHSAVLTANWIAANPDFESIKSSNYQTYYYEPVSTTFQRVQGSLKALELEKQGLNDGIFYPQFHGREHVHVMPWLKQLQMGNKALSEAFNLSMISFHEKGLPGCISDYLDAYNATDPEDAEFINDAIQDGLQMFYNTWGFHSETSIAPCYFWHPDQEDVMQHHKVKLMQGLSVQKIPTGVKGEYKRKRHYNGEKSPKGMIYSTRNVFFEPSLLPNKYIVESCLKQVNLAFTFKRPAVVSCHRLNFIGNIQPENRKKNIDLLKRFLKGVVKNHPDVHFIHSAQLVEFYS